VARPPGRGRKGHGETIIGLVKTECMRITALHNGAFITIATVEYAAMGWGQLELPSTGAAQAATAVS
jgi:hypothetical protein